MTQGHDARLEDRALIADVLAFYCEKLDDYDIDAVSTAFTEDCLFDPGPGNGGPRRGKAEVFPAQKLRMATFRRTFHQLGQSRVEFEGPDEARASTYVTAWHQRWNTSIGVSRLRYLDRLIRREGRWLIAERVLLGYGVEGFEDDVWNPSLRNTPPRPAGH